MAFIIGFVSFQCFCLAIFFYNAVLLFILVFVFDFFIGVIMVMVVILDVVIDGED